MSKEEIVAYLKLHGQDIKAKADAGNVAAATVVSFFKQWKATKDDMYRVACGMAIKDYQCFRG